MWKWIVGAAAVILVLLIGTCWYGYRKLTAGGDTASVAIAASPERVFASLADPDSMAAWMGAGSRVTAPHHGLLAVGDTLRVETAADSRSRQQYIWIVNDVMPDRLLVLQMRSDTGGVFATRRDSLVPRGDSTIIYSTIASPMIDSMRTQRGDTGSRMRGALLNFGSKVLISAFRLASENELKHLKARLEAHEVPAR
jgi:uncharacterized protein YndB with AHSA1/START domain